MSAQSRNKASLLMKFRKRLRTAPSLECMRFALSSRHTGRERSAASSRYALSGYTIFQEVTVLSTWPLYVRVCMYAIFEQPSTFCECAIAQTGTHSSSRFSHFTRLTRPRLRILILLPTNRDHIISSFTRRHNHTEFVRGRR